MFLDELCHHHHHDDVTTFAASSSEESTSSMGTAEAMAVGAGITSILGAGAYMAWLRVSKWSLRDSGVQVPEFDQMATTPQGRGATTPVMGETGDPSEFLSPTPGGKLRKNQRARFF